MIADIILCGLIFIISDAIVMYEARYWRPIDWGIYWIVVTVINGIIGIVGAQKRSPGYLIVFIVLTIMFSSINISHANQMRGEIFRTCKHSQIIFQSCHPVHDLKAAQFLSHCIFNNTCTADDIGKTDCKAPGSAHCDKVNTTTMFFFVNSLLNFMSYAEPCFWAVLLLIRAEKTGDTCPDEPHDAQEFPHPEFPSLVEDASEVETTLG